MAILRAYVPEIVEIPIKIRNLKPEERFRTEDGGEYMRMQNHHWSASALCYKAGKHSTPGEVYGFDGEADVIWLRRVYNTQQKYPPDCCQHCGTKLVSDVNSSRFGDWCPNEKCYH